MDGTEQRHVEIIYAAGQIRTHQPANGLPIPKRTFAHWPTVGNVCIAIGFIIAFEAASRISETRNQGAWGFWFWFVVFALLNPITLLGGNLCDKCAGGYFICPHCANCDARNAVSRFSTVPIGGAIACPACGNHFAKPRMG